jgi:hypothetical protein
MGAPTRETATRLTGVQGIRAERPEIDPLYLTSIVLLVIGGACGSEELTLHAVASALVAGKAILLFLRNLKRDLCDD